MLGFVTGSLAFDALLIPSAWLPDFAPYLAPLPKPLLDSAEGNEILPTYRALMSWQNRWMALTLDGDAAMNIDWTDTGVLAADPLQSPIAGDGFFTLPGSREIWNTGTQQWDRLPQARSVTFLAFGGWIGVVPDGQHRADRRCRCVRRGGASPVNQRNGRWHIRVSFEPSRFAAEQLIEVYERLKPTASWARETRGIPRSLPVCLQARPSSRPEPPDLPRAGQSSGLGSQRGFL